MNVQCIQSITQRGVLYISAEYGPSKYRLEKSGSLVSKAILPNSRVVSSLPRPHYPAHSRSLTHSLSPSVCLSLSPSLPFTLSFLESFQPLSSARVCRVSPSGFALPFGLITFWLSMPCISYSMIKIVVLVVIMTLCRRYLEIYSQMILVHLRGASWYNSHNISYPISESR